MDAWIGLTGFADGLTGFAEGMVQQYTYLGAFGVLVMCGLGVPIPEEVTIVGAGFLLHRGHVEHWAILGTCYAGVLVGDAIPYTVGRLWGDRAFEHRWVRRVLHKQRMERLETRFREHLVLGVFSCRFLPGARWPGYFIAGHLGMPAWKWLTLDAIGAAIMVPVILHLGRAFGANVDLAQSTVEDFGLLMAFVAFALLLTVVVRSRILRDRARAEREAAAADAAAVAAQEEAEDERPERIEGF